MKTMKKLFATMFAFALSLSLCAAPTAFAAGTHVYDEVGVLSASEVAALEATAQKYEDEYAMGVYLLFVNNLGSTGDANDYAKSFYQRQGLGVGQDADGIILLVAVQSRDFAIVKHAEGGYDPISDSGVNAIDGNATSYLHDNDWYDGAKAYYDTVGEQLDYYAATGRQWTEPDPIGFVLKILATLGIPAGVAAAMVRGDKAAMKTARERDEAHEYLNSESFNLTVSNDEFITKNVVAAPLPKNDGDSGGGGSGSGWTSMGGGFSGHSGKF